MANRVTVKGQVTIPKRVREHLGIKPGGAVEFVLSNEGEVTLRKAGRRAGRQAGSRFAALRGSATAGLSTEEILALTRAER